MITNTGKNIIARYLIGDAPAYASYLALGCGAKPRQNISTITSVSTEAISGTVLSTGSPAVDGKFITPVSGISSTAGLRVGMVLTKTSGTGAFGSNATITSIDSITQITISATTANTTGNLSFKTSGSAMLLSGNTDGLWVGAKITILSGTGTLSSVSDTLVTSINSSSSFTVSPSPLTDVTSATIGLEVDPNKKSLDFEMFRVPITSRGYVNDNGTNKIVLTAQLPTEERYEISEIGVYSAGSNASAGQYDSKTISAFSSEEEWELSLDNSLVGPSPTSAIFPEITTSLISGLNFMNSSAPAIKTNTSNGLFSNIVRSARYERPRYLTNVLLLKGNTSFIYENQGVLAKYGTPAYLQISSLGTDLSKNSSSDLMKFAFSLIAVDGNSTTVPDNVKIIVEFSNNSGDQFAQMQINASDVVYRFTDNRYVVATKRLDELVYSEGSFSWKNIENVKVYTSISNDLVATNKVANGTQATITTTSPHGLAINDWVKVSGVGSSLDGIHKVLSVTNDTFTYASTQTVSSQLIDPAGKVEATTGNYYIAIDALRVDNISTVNPLYGLTGYSIVQNEQEKTIIKSPNTSNYVEYRFILDVT